MITIETTTEAIESKGGLLLIGKIAQKAGLGNIHSRSVKNAAAVIASLFANMAEGNTGFERIGDKRDSLFFREALCLPFNYAKETVRIYLGKMEAEADGIIKQLAASSAKIIRQSKPHGVWVDGKEYIPIDVDTVAMDNSKSKKEGVSRTYRGFDGYHPIMAYFGKEGYMLNCELRPGSQHCQKGTVEFIQETKMLLGEARGGGRILFRFDGGNDSFGTLKAATEGKGHYCIIKRNKRRESDEKWLARAKRYGRRIPSRKGKKVWVGMMQIHPRKKDETVKNIKCVFEVTERKTDGRGNRFLFPEIEVSLWWTNLDCAAEKVIELYHGHATSEQFHSELKSDMGVERLPSGNFAVNRILLAVAMNAYNALRLLGQKSIETKKRAKFKRKRLGTIIRNLICVAGKVVRHARCLVFKIYEKDPVLPTFLRLNTELGCT